MRIDRKSAAVLALVALAGAVIGCANTKSSESAEPDKLTTHVGTYPPAPAMAERPRVGIPPFKVDASGGSSQHLNEIAADQMTTLATLSGRFDVIERAQLTQLIDEQNLEGVVKAGELARPGQVRGVDYLILGKVTNLRVKAEKSRHGMNIAQVGLPFGGGAGAFDFKDTRSKVTTECGVDIRLVDPTSGKVAAAHFGEFKRTDSIGALGVSILGFRSESEADLQLSDDDKGKVLRLAFDEALRKMLPQVDQAIIARGRTNTPAAVAPASVAPAGNAAVAQPAAEKKFCAQCGKQVAAGAKFCAACGAKAQ
jgi:curli biogenesis system outer membrane secretion channel CsgG